MIPTHILMNISAPNAIINGIKNRLQPYIHFSLFEHSLAFFLIFLSLHYYKWCSGMEFNHRSDFINPGSCDNTSYTTAAYGIGSTKIDHLTVIIAQ